MIYMWFTGMNYCKLGFEKDRDSIFTTIWKPGFTFPALEKSRTCNNRATYIREKISRDLIKTRLI
jgi:hypothetical protein